MDEYILGNYGGGGGIVTFLLMIFDVGMNPGAADSKYLTVTSSSSTSISGVYQSIFVPT